MKVSCVKVTWYENKRFLPSLSWVCRYTRLNFTNDGDFPYYLSIYSFTLSCGPIMGKRLQKYEEFMSFATNLIACVRGTHAPGINCRIQYIGHHLAKLYIKIQRNFLGSTSKNMQIVGVWLRLSLPFPCPYQSKMTHDSLSTVARLSASYCWEESLLFHFYVFLIFLFIFTSLQNNWTGKENVLHC